MKNDLERELVEACQSARPESLDAPFRLLYDRYKDRVYNTCFRITGSTSDALDASQEVFLTLSRKIQGFRFESRFSSWVYRIAVNASYSILRTARARRARSLDALALGGLSDRDYDELVEQRIEQPAVWAIRRDNASAVAEALTRLSTKLRTVLVLRYLEDLSYEEIGETLHIAQGTVKSRLHRAHNALRNELSPMLETA